MAEEWWLDYSAAKLSAATIKATPVGPKGERPTGVIRYIDHPNSLGWKHTTKAEYDDHVRNGLAVWLVAQGGINDADTGWAGGVNRAHRALAGARYLGYPDHLPIFVTNDRIPSAGLGRWTDYLDGAASVLGRHRTGAYGFYNAVDAARGHADWFWQAGRRTDVRAHVHFWQDNNFQPRVGGIATDRNLVLRPLITGAGSAPPIPSVPPIVSEDDIMAVLPTGSRKTVSLGVPTGAKKLVVSTDWAKTVVHQVVIAGGNYPSDRSKADFKGFKAGERENVVDASRPWVIPLPAGALSVGLSYSTAEGNHPGATFQS